VVEQMAASIKEFGFKIPVLARSDGSVVDGHLRLKAAQLLKLETVPVILCDEWTDAQVKAFRLMVNRSVTWADWDDDLLSLEFEDLKGLDFDLALTGFDKAKIDSLFGEPLEGDAWKGMPEFRQDDLSPKYSIIVHFDGPENREKFSALIGQKLTDDTRSIWYPRAEIGHYADKRYVNPDEATVES
jgi:hypothetical protein